MNDKLRAAAQRLIDAPMVATGIFAQPSDFGWAGSPLDAINVATAFLACPAWHDRPTGPGLWVCMPDGKQFGRRAEALRLTEEDLARGAPFHVLRVFGPVPEENRDGE